MSIFYERVVYIWDCFFPFSFSSPRFEFSAQHTDLAVVNVSFKIQSKKSSYLSFFFFSLQEVLEPQFVLVLAWALGQVVKDVQTAEYLASALEAGIPAYLLPALVSVRLLTC